MTYNVEHLVVLLKHILCSDSNAASTDEDTDGDIEQKLCCTTLKLNSNDLDKTNDKDSKQRSKHT